MDFWIYYYYYYSWLTLPDSSSPQGANKYLRVFASTMQRQIYYDYVLYVHIYVLYLYNCESMLYANIFCGPYRWNDECVFAEMIRSNDAREGRLNDSQNASITSRDNKMIKTGNYQNY